jgi:K+-transporting ATPase KdpF subunit
MRVACHFLAGNSFRQLGLRLRALTGTPIALGATMILLTAIVTALLFVYLLAALFRPDWF